MEESLSLEGSTLSKLTAYLSSEIARYFLKKRANHFLVLERGQYCRIPYDTILLFEGAGRCAKVYCLDGSRLKVYHVPETLRMIEDVLDDDLFVRIHKRFIVNVAHVVKCARGMSRGGIQLDFAGPDLPKIRYSKTYAPALKARRLIR